MKTIKTLTVTARKMVKTIVADITAAVRVVVESPSFHFHWSNPWLGQGNSPTQDGVLLRPCLADARYRRASAPAEMLGAEGGPRSRRRLLAR